MNREELQAGADWPTGRASRLVIGATALLGLALSGIARAHHGFDGRYDMAAPLWIEGVVVDAHFGNPHSQLTVRVPDDVRLPSPPPDLGPAASFLEAGALVVPGDIVGQDVVLELPPTPQYSMLGDRVHAGDKIFAVAIRNCEPPHQFNVQWLQLPGGGVESRTGAMSYMVEGC
jgi:hypothetical protein